jgi:hypothetical protein
MDSGEGPAEILEGSGEHPLSVGRAIRTTKSGAINRVSIITSLVVEV